jgi:3-oxoacyl-[acyl-carrier-protein] synthase-3
VLADVAHEVLDAAGMTTAQVDWLIPHQANVRILQATAKRLHIRWKNASSRWRSTATPRRLRCRWRSMRRCAMAASARGQHLLLEGVGGGFTWGAALLKF